MRCFDLFRNRSLTWFLRPIIAIVYTWLFDCGINAAMKIEKVTQSLNHRATSVVGFKPRECQVLEYGIMRLYAVTIMTFPKGQDHLLGELRN